MPSPCMPCWCEFSLQRWWLVARVLGQQLNRGHKCAERLPTCRKSNKANDLDAVSPPLSMDNCQALCVDLCKNKVMNLSKSALSSWFGICMVLPLNRSWVMSSQHHTFMI